VALLAVVQFARATGFSLEDTKQLVRGVSKGTPMSKRWRELANAKIEDLDALIARATAMKALLQRISTNCGCETLVECGRRLAGNRSRWATGGRHAG